MGKLILFNFVTADGFFAGPSGEIDWHNTDQEFADFAIEQLKTIGTVLFGRITYEMMKSYWPSQEAISSDPITAKIMNEIPKVVFSRTMKNADWNNTILIKENVEKEVRKIKESNSKDVYIFGSANLASTLINLGLVDELRIMINPLLLGKGKPLFSNINKKHNLKLLQERKFANGNVLLCYKIS